MDIDVTPDLSPVPPSAYSALLSPVPLSANSSLSGPVPPSVDSSLSSPIFLSADSTLSNPVPPPADYSLTSPSPVNSMPLSSLSPDSFSLSPVLSLSCSTTSDETTLSSPESPVSTNTTSNTSPDLYDSVVGYVQALGYNLPSLTERTFFSASKTQLVVQVPDGCDPPEVLVAPSRSWLLNYTVISFMLNGHLYAEYKRLQSMLGLPHCSDSQWERITEWLEKRVTEVADWTCEQVRMSIKKRGDQKKWIASYDGYYQTRGHYSNNSSATLHDYSTGNIAWYKNRTKRGMHHNWEGTSAGAEANMLDEILMEVKQEGFAISEIVADKDSSLNSIFCRYFPEGTITYCSNHCSKTLHKDLQRIKQSKCVVS